MGMCKSAIVLSILGQLCAFTGMCGAVDIAREYERGYTETLTRVKARGNCITKSKIAKDDYYARGQRDACHDAQSKAIRAVRKRLKRGIK